MRKKVTSPSLLVSVSAISIWGLVNWAASWVPLAPHSAIATAAQSSAATAAKSPDRSLQPIAQNRTTPPVPPLPEPLPMPRTPGMAGIVGLTPAAETDIGVGHLRPQDISFLDTAEASDSPLLNAGWLRSAAVPIYIEPDGAHWGWIVNGWLVPNGQAAIALGQDATFSMLQTFEALLSFPVMQIREDGWFQFQYTPAGRAWAHVDHLNLGRIDLAIETWQNHSLKIGRVQFRQDALSQALYDAPNEAEGNIAGLVGPDSLIEPLGFDGDWMQVRITQPADGCSALSGAVTQEGWMRWRNGEDQSLVWFPPQGC